MKYIGLDVGTSGCKAAVVDSDGNVFANKSREYSFEISKGHIELNPDTVWNAVYEVLCELGPHARDAAALSVSSIGEAFVILNDNDRPLANGIVYLDNRSAETLPEIAGKIAVRELYDITGMYLHQMFSLSRFVWQQKYTPKVIKEAEKFCMFGDFITYKLTGQRAIDPSSASRTMMFDSKKREWSDRIMDLFAVPKNKFSPVMKTGTIIGSILPDLAGKTGLRRDLKVVLGCHDQCSATLGSGIYGGGMLMLGEGSSESINAVIEYNHIDRDMLFSKQIAMEPYITPGEYIVPLGILQHGTAIKWFVTNNKAYYDTIPPLAGESLFARADRLSAQDSGGLYFIPYLTRSNIMDVASCAPGCFIGLEYTSDINTMYRAVLEGLSFESKCNLLILEQTGYKPVRLVATGGGAKSSLFMQIKSDILGCKIDIPKNTDSGIIGLAMICAVAMGEYTNYAQAAERFIRIKESYTPHTGFEKRLETYTKINKAIKELYNTI
ncbi:xylulokinase [Spirochaetia bacterium]|nr:xylulokinase [Spirochaetia bacterium]